jgi:hypothetical protein
MKTDGTFELLVNEVDASKTLLDHTNVGNKDSYITAALALIDHFKSDDFAFAVFSAGFRAGVASVLFDENKVIRKHIYEAAKELNDRRVKGSERTDSGKNEATT